MSLGDEIKKARNSANLTQKQLGEYCGVKDNTVSDWENNKSIPNADTIKKICDLTNTAPNKILSYAIESKLEETEKIIKNSLFDNATIIDINSGIIKIPIYGTIKAGVPIESQSDIIDYVDIPKAWTKGNKQFYGLKISGDSMFPKYNENDIVIFEQNNDTEMYNGKDCAVMINGTESTFKKLLVNEQGIVLQPYNTAYDIMMFSKEQVEQLPIKVVGIAREKEPKLIKESMMKKIIIIIILLIMFLPLCVYAGCCSWHQGIDYCGENGYYICKDGTESPTCECNYNPPTFNNKNDSSSNLDDIKKNNIKITSIVDNELEEKYNKLNKKYEKIKTIDDNNAIFSIIIYLLTLGVLNLFEPKKVEIKNKFLKGCIALINFLLVMTFGIFLIPFCLGIYGYFGLEVISILLIFFIFVLKTG